MKDHFACFDIGLEVPVIVEYKDEYQKDTLGFLIRYRVVNSNFSEKIWIGNEEKPLATGDSIQEIKNKIPEYFL